MICISSKLPILQVGKHQLADYETSWLLRSIEGGLSKIEIEDTNIAKDIYFGVLHYLENDTPWKPLKIESLYSKVDKVFGKIGFPHAQGKIPQYCPVIHVSVMDILQQLDCKIEMALFNTLKSDLEALLPYGVEKVVLEEVIEAVHALIPAKKWNKECQSLHDELLTFQEKYNDPYRRNNHFLPAENRTY